MVGDKIKYSRSTIKYKGGNNMKELTYDELIKNNGGNNETDPDGFAEHVGYGIGKTSDGVKSFFVALPTHLNNLNYKGW